MQTILTTITHSTLTILQHPYYYIIHMYNGTSAVRTPWGLLEVGEVYFIWRVHLVM